ncbi:pyridoxal phosphate-dependent aminotransferase [Nocardia harenae]|uniref:pyridoxal phosphate-dependent aminotransferase n=1 Tax=Nocardia harenae TaxID=358707 RepID=UPI000A9C0AC5|nr:pyridoxal phosphate-dependent aminotransferase [Nocardia harenae]
MTGPALATVTQRSEQRKRRVKRLLTRDHPFPGTGGRSYAGVIDAYHGETGLAPHPAAVAALDRAWHDLLHGTPPDDYTDGSRYDKRQPMVLRELAARRMFGGLAQPAPDVPGVRVRPEEVIVCAYTSTMLLEEAIATIARPGGVLVCPEGFYKSAGLHVEKYGLRIVTCPVSPDDSFTIDPERLDSCLTELRASGELCGVLLTLPGNPVVAHYSAADLAAIGRVLLAADTPVICDAAFDHLASGHIPIAAIEVEGRRLYDRVLTITGNSKGYNAFGPCKMGAACGGDAAWLTRIADRLTLSFQRETTHLARAIVEHTPDEYFAGNRARMRAQMDRAICRVRETNDRLGRAALRPLGTPDGMFLTLQFDAALLEAAGVADSAELEDLLLVAAGVDSVALNRTGSARAGVRLNVLAPRRAPRQESPELLDELLDRIERLLLDMASGLRYPDALAALALEPVHAPFHGPPARPLAALGGPMRG